MEQDHDLDNEDLRRARELVDANPDLSLEEAIGQAQQERAIFARRKVKSLADEQYEHLLWGGAGIGPTPEKDDGRPHHLERRMCWERAVAAAPDYPEDDAPPDYDQFLKALMPHEKKRDRREARFKDMIASRCGRVSEHVGTGPNVDEEIEALKAQKFDRRQWVLLGAQFEHFRPGEREPRG